MKKWEVRLNKTFACDIVKFISIKCLFVSTFGKVLHTSVFSFFIIPFASRHESYVTVSGERRCVTQTTTHYPVIREVVL